MYETRDFHSSRYSLHGLLNIPQCHQVEIISSVLEKCAKSLSKTLTFLHLWCHTVPRTQQWEVCSHHVELEIEGPTHVTYCVCSVCVALWLVVFMVSVQPWCSTNLCFIFITHLDFTSSITVDIGSDLIWVKINFLGLQWHYGWLDWSWVLKWKGNGRLWLWLIIVTTG